MANKMTVAIPLVLAMLVSACGGGGGGGDAPASIAGAAPAPAPAPATTPVPAAAAPAPAPANLIQSGAFASFGPAMLVSDFPKTTDRGLLSSARLAGGGSVVAWSNGTSAFVQRLGADGRPVGATQTVGPVLTGDSAVQTRLSAAATADGGWLVAWTAPDRTVSFLRYDVSGVPVGVAAPVDATAFSRVLALQARAMGDGTFVVAWVAAEGAGATRAFVRRFSAAGSAATDRVALGDSAGAQTAVQITPLADGNFLAAWVQANTDGTDTLLARRLDARLNAAGPEQVLQPAAQFHPYGFLAAASLSQGGALVAWGYTTSFIEVRWQVLDASGNATLPGGSPGSSGNIGSGMRLLSSVEAVPSATGFRIVAETVEDTPRSTDARTHLLDVGRAGELLGSTASYRQLESVSATKGTLCKGPYGSQPGVAAAGGEDGHYLLAYATCPPPADAPVLPYLEVVGY